MVAIQGNKALAAQEPAPNNENRDKPDVTTSFADNSAYPETDHPNRGGCCRNLAFEILKSNLVDF